MITLTHIADLLVTVGEPVVVGIGPRGLRRVIPITGGTVQIPPWTNDQAGRKKSSTVVLELVESIQRPTRAGGHQLESCADPSIAAKVGGTVNIAG